MERRPLLAAVLALAAACSCARTEVEDVPALLEKARHGDGAAAGRLTAAMASPDHDLSLAAYQAVLSAKEGCTPALLAGVRSRDPAQFEAAAAALANLKVREAVPDLSAALAEGGDRAISAAWALGMIGDPASIPLLARALFAPGHDLRKAAVRALGRMGEPVEEEVVRLWRSGGLPPSLTPEGERAAIRVLGEIRAKSAVPLLLAARPENRDAAVWALGRIQDKAAADSVQAAMDDPRWQVRREAAQALGTLGDRAVVPALRRALADPEFIVREWAARSLLTLTGEDILYRDEDGKMVPPYNLYH